MASDQRIAGIISVSIDGELQQAEGDFEINLGAAKRETLIGSDAVHGFKETPQAPMIKGTIRNRRTLDVRRMVELTNATIHVGAGNGKAYVLRDAWFSGDGNINTGDSKIDVEFTGRSCEEVA